MHSFRFLGGIPLRAGAAARDAPTLLIPPQAKQFTCSSSENAMAEEAGFEPANPCGLHAFQACAFDHSATLPNHPVLFFPNNRKKSSSENVTIL